MRLYNFLRQYLAGRDAAMLVALWYAALLFLIFLGVSQTGIDLRYANM